jgi:hypothetical protein
MVFWLRFLAGFYTREDLHLFAFPMPKMYLHCHSKRLILSAFQMKNGVKWDAHVERDLNSSTV